MGEDAGLPITSAPCETYYRGRPGQDLLINLEGADIGFDALETDNIVSGWWIHAFHTARSEHITSKRFLVSNEGWR